MCFFNRAQAPKNARRINAGTYPELVSQLRDGEELVGQYDHGLHVELVKLDAKLYSEHLEEERQGVLGILGYWARPI